MTCWLSLEIFDAGASAGAWRRAHGSWLAEAAVTNGALVWNWQTTRWGVVLEIEFADEHRRADFRTSPAVRAALDAVPDPVSGLLVYPGRGGTSGAAVRRRPRPSPSAGHVELPEPGPQRRVLLAV